MVATESVTIRVPVGMAKYLSSKNPGYKDLLLWVLMPQEINLF